MRSPDGLTPIRTGDVFIHPPGVPPPLLNTGTTELEVLIIADHPPVDAGHDPDSHQWSLRPPGKSFRPAEADDGDGEE